jgi:hypothetical protein
MSAEWAARPSQPIQPTSTNQKTHFTPVNLSLMHFTKDIPSSNEPFLCQNLKTNYNYNLVPYGAHGTEKVNPVYHSILFHSEVTHLLDIKTYRNSGRTAPFNAHCLRNKSSHLPVLVRHMAVHADVSYFFTDLLPGWVFWLRLSPGNSFHQGCDRCVIYGLQCQQAADKYFYHLDILCLHQLNRKHTCMFETAFVILYRSTSLNICRENAIDI